ncbi:MAG: hypothetical protein IT302_04925 [Dehalococcoidia bacterium]|nr:hypothetical protein [Dehalococcoidia bacterium]
MEQPQGENEEALQLQKTVGNRAASEAIAARRAEPPIQRLLDAGGATVQRATFAELMAFWKKQELGEDPAQEEAKGEESPNVPPEPESLPEDVKAMNPAVEEEAGQQEQGPSAYQVYGANEEKSGGGLRGPVAYQVYGGNEAKGGGGSIAYTMHGASGGQQEAKGPDVYEAPEGDDEKGGGGLRGPVAYKVYGASGGQQEAKGPDVYEAPESDDEKDGGGLRGPVAYQVYGASGGQQEAERPDVYEAPESDDEKGGGGLRGPVAYQVYGANGGQQPDGGGYGVYRPVEPEPEQGEGGQQAPQAQQPQGPAGKYSIFGGWNAMDESKGQLSMSDEVTPDDSDESELPGMDIPQLPPVNAPAPLVQGPRSAVDGPVPLVYGPQGAVNEPQPPVQLGPNQVAGNKTKVKYLETTEARNEFKLEVGGSITQGGEPFDTSKMYSKFMGDGFGIYVMAKDGTFYATSHKIGLFHHSSFLGGGDVAGAGEMKVVGGTLQFITNKSGHYWPGDQELAQTLNELQAASGFSSAGLAQLLPAGGLKNPYPGGPTQFLQDHPVGVLNNKDGTKYGGKAMTMDKSEKENSVSLVRSLIASYVKSAQLGKLRKFNKPNPEFGKTTEDIKALVLAEFGWNDQDVANYEEVLKNWNNDKEIVEVPQGSPPPVQVSESVESDQSSLTSASADDEKSASGRDWDAELEELLQANPDPDWQGLGLEPYGSGVILWNEDHSSYTYATAKQQVRLLKGEATIDEIRS